MTWKSYQSHVIVLIKDMELSKLLRVIGGINGKLLNSIADITTTLPENHYFQCFDPTFGQAIHRCAVIYRMGWNLNTEAPVILSNSVDRKSNHSIA